MANLSSLLSGLQGRQNIDPRLYDVVKILASEVETLKNPTARFQHLEYSPSDDVPSATTGSYTLTKTNVLLSWNDVEGADYYDVRKGSDWETAERIGLPIASALALNPINVGITSYLIGTVKDGEISTSRLQIDVVVPALGYLSLETTVLDNFVLIRWIEPTTTFRIDYYKFERGNVLIGNSPNTFITYFERAAGDVDYFFTPVDIAGNEGPEVCIQVTVRNPIDLEFDNVLTLDDADSITLVNAYQDDDLVLAPVNNTETWSEHFTRAGASSIQDKIDAGYNIWCQPNESPGSITLRFIIPTQLTDINFEINWSFREIIPSVSVTSQLINGGVTQNGRSLFVSTLNTTFDVKLNFTAFGQGIVELLTFQAAILTKKAQDSGFVSALSTDTSGTLVTVNRDYVAVPEITATVRDSGSFLCVVHDKTNTTFRVSVFNDSGNRASKTVDWHARGII